MCVVHVYIHGAFCYYITDHCRTVVSRKKIVQPQKGLPAWGSSFPEDVSNCTCVFNVQYVYNTLASLSQ